MHVPSRNIRAANAIYYYQRAQLSACRSIIDSMDLQIWNLNMAYEHCTTSYELCNRINDRTVTMLAEKDGIILQQKIVIRGLSVSLAAGFGYIIYRKIKRE
jgi:hypothetical protein